MSATPAPAHDEQLAPSAAFRAFIQARAESDDSAAGAPSSADLRLINKLARRPLTADEIYVFDCIPSNDQLDAYYTHMGQSSLKNYVRDAKVGIAIMNSHRTGGWGKTLELPIGRSFRGELVKGEDITEFHSSAYMLRGIKSSDVANDDLIRMIEGGQVFDISIGFSPGWWQCDVCKLDIFDFKCRHFPGWPVLDADGNETDVIATATVQDASLREYSLVYDGATPGAMIEKARALTEAGDAIASPARVALLEERFHVRLRPGTTVPVLKPAREIVIDQKSPVLVTRATHDERIDDMTGAELIAAMLERGATDDLRPLLEEGLRRCEARNDDAVSGALDIANAFVELRHSQLTTDIATLTARVAELEPQAADGAAYRESLIADALAWGVRAEGERFDQARWERLLREPSRTIDDLRSFQADFQAKAPARLGNGGRQTATPDPNDPSGLGALPAESRRRDLSQFVAP